MDRTDFVGYFAIVVIVISLLSLGLSLTGRVTDTGIVNVTIESIVSINFTTELLYFGSGSVDTGQSSATLYTNNGSVNNGNWTGESEGFIVENVGNNNVSLRIMAGKTAAQFIGGTNPAYRYNVTNSEASSCTANVAFNLGTLYDVNVTGPSGTLVCDTFEYLDARDTIRIDLALAIPSDAAGGDQTDTFTATATAV